MAGQTYDSNKFQYPGEFRCSEVALISLSGNIAGIKSSITELNIYESLTNNFISGDVTFVDTADLLDEMPIIGAEYLDFKIRTPIRSSYRDPTTSTTKPGTKTFFDYGGYNFTNVRMSVYKIGTKKPLSDNTQMVTLNFCSPEMIRNQNVRVSRAFDGPYDKAVADLFKKSFGLNSKKRCYIQPTKNNFRLVWALPYLQSNHRVLVTSITRWPLGYSYKRSISISDKGPNSYMAPTSSCFKAFAF